MLQTDLATFDPNNTGLAGGLRGKEVLGALIAQAPHPDEPSPYFLNFGKVKGATASFVRACVIGFKDFARRQIPNLYPVVANASPLILEDLLLALEHQADAMVVCDLSDDGTVSNARILGRLEPKQVQTLEAVLEVGESDAGSLYERFKGQDNVASATVWNNRLAALTEKGFLVERSLGRAKAYRGVLSELRYGK